jgi:hypothetical protein
MSNQMEIECKKQFEAWYAANLRGRRTLAEWIWNAAWNASREHYAGGQPERLTSAPSDAGVTTPDRQGEALIAEPPAPITDHPTDISVTSEVLSDSMNITPRDKRAQFASSPSYQINEDAYDQAFIGWAPNYYDPKSDAGLRAFLQRYISCHNELKKADAQDKLPPEWDHATVAPAVSVSRWHPTVEEHQAVAKQMADGFADAEQPVETPQLGIGFDAAIASLGPCDDEFNQWHLDEGNLRWFAARCFEPRQPEREGGDRSNSLEVSDKDACLSALQDKFDSLYVTMKIIEQRGEPDDEAVLLAKQALAEIDDNRRRGSDAK